MPRYYDLDKLAEMIRAKADTLIAGKEAFLYVAKWLDFLPSAAVAPESEVVNLEYKLMGVMHSVDKWLEGEELEKDEVNRAATMREKTLQIIEDAKIAVKEYQHNWQKIHDSYTADCLEHYNKGRSEVAMEIFEEIEELAKIYTLPVIQKGIVGIEKEPFWCIEPSDIANIKKKYTNQP